MFFYIHTALTYKAQTWYLFVSDQIMMNESNLKIFSTFSEYKYFCKYSGFLRKYIFFYPFFAFLQAVLAILIKILIFVLITDGKKIKLQTFCGHLRISYSNLPHLR